MDQNSKKPSLKGKRKKPVPANANPLFTQWLTEWRDEAAEKGWKSHHTYSRALKTLKKFPLTLESGKDCKLLQNFGDKICKMLDEKLADYQQNNGSVQKSQEKASATSQKTPSPSKTHIISDNSDSEPDLKASPPKKKRQTSQRKQREYVPGYRSGPYAVILTLYRYMQDPDFKGFMTKKELSHSAQPLCDKSFTMPDPGSHYTAWSSVSSLIKRGLVHKDGCPARYILTDEGQALGNKLEHAENGSTSDQQQSGSDSNTVGNAFKDSSLNVDHMKANVADEPTSPSAQANRVGPSTHIVLSDSEEECDNEIIQNNSKEPDCLKSPVFSHEPVYVLSDDEDQKMEPRKERARNPSRHIRLHSLSSSSSSSSLSPLPHDYDEPSVSLNDNAMLCKSPSPTRSSPVKALSPLTNDMYDGDIIEVENPDNGHLNNFTSGSHISKFSWEEREKRPVFLVTEEDDDELPDLDQYISLSKRLMSKGLTSALFNNHGSSTGSGVLPSTSNSRVKEKVDVDTGTDEDNPIDLESMDSADYIKSPYTLMKDKSTENKSFSGKAVSTSTDNMDRLSPDVQQLSSSSSAQSHPAVLESSNSKPVPLFTFLPDTFDIVLCVDQREFYGSKSNSKTLLPDLIKSGINCDLRHLNISDLLWVAREKSAPAQSLDNSRGRELVLNYAIERKRMDDLVSSISSGRLKEQKFRLKHSGISELIILIEEYGSIQNFSLSEDRIKQSIVNSQIIDGFKVKRCASSKDAISYLSLMTRFLQSHYHSKTLHAVSHEWLKDNKKSCINESEQYLMPFDVFNDASLKQKTLSVKEMFAKQLLQIPGISLERANAITKVYPTLSLLLAAYKNCDSEKSKESLLASIKCGNKQRNLGIAVSRTLSMMYNSTGPLS